METAKHEHWSAKLIRIGNLAMREAQARNRELGRVINRQGLSLKLAGESPDKGA